MSGSPSPPHQLATPSGWRAGPRRSPRSSSLSRWARRGRRVLRVGGRRCCWPSSRFGRPGGVARGAAGPGGCCGLAVALQPSEAQRQPGRGASVLRDPNKTSHRWEKQQEGGNAAGQLLERLPRAGVGKRSGCPRVGGMGRLLRSALRIIHWKWVLLFLPPSLSFFFFSFPLSNFSSASSGTFRNTPVPNSCSRAVSAPLLGNQCREGSPGALPRPLAKALLAGRRARAEPCAGYLLGENPSI